MNGLDFHIVDVFTGRAFAGNPLAVVLGADDLTAGQMQSIAAEFNLSETVFPLPPSASGADYRARIFTPLTELPFAGHPSVGLAWQLHQLGRLPAGVVQQECGAGVVPLTVDAAGAELTGAKAEVGSRVDATELLDAVRLLPEHLGAQGEPGTASAGIPFTLLPLASREAVDLADPDGRGLTGRGEVLVFSWADGVAYARMFGRDVGVREDPATGSAALALGVWLVAEGLLPPDGESSYVVEQGWKMGRPSLLTCRVTAAGGRAETCRVRGQVTPVAQGRIRVPGS